MSLDRRLAKIEEAIYLIRLKLASTDEEAEQIKYERQCDLEREWEEEMGEDM